MNFTFEVYDPDKKKTLKKEPTRSIQEVTTGPVHELHIRSC